MNGIFPRDRVVLDGSCRLSVNLDKIRGGKICCKRACMQDSKYLQSESVWLGLVAKNSLRQKVHSEVDDWCGNQLCQYFAKMCAGSVEQYHHLIMIPAIYLASFSSYQSCKCNYDTKLGYYAILNLQSTGNQWALHPAINGKEVYVVQASSKPLLYFASARNTSLPFTFTQHYTVESGLRPLTTTSLTTTYSTWSTSRGVGYRWPQMPAIVHYGILCTSNVRPII